MVRLDFLGSGSRGNATLVQCQGTRLLVECGFTGKELKRRLGLVGLNPAEVTAVLVSHEHTDHWTGLCALPGTVPVFLTRGTDAGIAAKRPRRKPCRAHVTVQAGQPIEVGCFQVTPFSLSHDAWEPVGFVLQAPGGIRLGFASDLGCASSEVDRALAGCQVLMLEANHDPQMLQQGPYPLWLRQRIASAKGHLSNQDAAALLDRVGGPDLRRVFAIHRSAANNRPDLIEAALVPILSNQKQPVALELIEQDQRRSVCL